MFQKFKYYINNNFTYDIMHHSKTIPWHMLLFSSENPGLHLVHLNPSPDAMHFSQWVTVEHSKIMNIKYVAKYKIQNFPMNNIWIWLKSVNANVGMKIFKLTFPESYWFSLITHNKAVFELYFRLSRYESPILLLQITHM